MNRNSIDFTKIGRCALCGCGVEDGSMELTIKSHTFKSAEYKNLKILVCEDCFGYFNPKNKKNFDSAKSFASALNSIEQSLFRVGCKFNEITGDFINSNPILKYSSSDIPKVFLTLKKTYPYINSLIEKKEIAYLDKLALIDHFLTNTTDDGWIPLHKATYRWYPDIKWTQRKLNTNDGTYKDIEYTGKMVSGLFCPVCGENIECTDDLDKLEINDDVHFRCKKNCIHFSIESLLKYFGKNYSKTAVEYVRYRHQYRFDTSVHPQYRYMTRGIPTPDEWVLNYVSNTINNFNSVFGMNTYVSVDAKNPDFRRKMNEVKNWKIGEDLEFGELIEKAKNAVQPPDKHCEHFSNLSPDRKTMYYCKLVDGPCDKFEYGKDYRLCRVREKENN